MLNSRSENTFKAFNLHFKAAEMKKKKKERNVKKRKIKYQQ